MKNVLLKKVFIALVVVIFCGGAGFALMNNIKTDQRSGCCSHHGGVCGCSHARAVCCDGSYSPSCGCD